LTTIIVDYTYITIVYDDYRNKIKRAQALHDKASANEKCVVQHLI